MSRVQRWLPVLLMAALLPASVAVAQAERPVRLAYTDWSSSRASASLLCAVIRQRLEQACELVAVDPEGLWRQTAAGEVDAFLSAWLPATHAHFMARFGDQLDDLGANLQGARIGLVVPAVRAGRQTRASGMRPPGYLAARAIADLTAERAQVQGRIIGIEPQAGVMKAAREALGAYDLNGFRLIEGDEASMTTALQRAIQRQEPIVITGWSPHWMFDRWALRFLDDPQGVFGGAEAIHTMARSGLASERPRIYRLLDRFQWSAEEMNRLLIWIAQDRLNDPEAQARRWMRAYPERVNAWLE